MNLNQSFISDFSEYSRWSQMIKIKYKLHYGWCTGRRFTAATLHNTSCSEVCGPSCNPETNDRGLKLLDFATYNNLLLANTLGNQKPSYKVIYNKYNAVTHAVNCTIMDASA